MATRRYGTFDMASAIEPDINMPLDARQHVRTKAERLDPESFPTLRSYKGLLVASRDEEKVFFLVDHNNPTLEESWKVIGPYDDTEIRNLINQVDTRITNQTFTGGTGITITKSGDSYTITNTSPGGLPADFNIVGGTNTTVAKNGNVYTINVADAEDIDVVSLSSNLTVTTEIV